jgi:hypothetical protein
VSMCASHDRISISVALLSEVKTTSEENVREPFAHIIPTLSDIIQHE